MGWLNILKGILGLANMVAKFVSDKQLMDAGEAKAVARNLSQTNEKLNAAIDARRNVRHDTDSVQRDKNNRRNRP